MRQAFLAALLALALSAAAETDAALSAAMDKVLNVYADRGCLYVARVVDADTGRELVLHEADRPVAPASNMKLPTTAAALDRFGPDFLWRTYLAIDGDDLWIVATGDPSLGDELTEKSLHEKRLQILDDWATALQKRGVTHLTGKLLYDDRIFDDEQIGATWPLAELQERWSAPLTGLTINQNRLDVVAFPDHVEYFPHTDGITLVNHTDKAAKTGVQMRRDAKANVFTLSGRVLKREDVEAKALVDPSRMFAEALRLKLKERGITIEGATERAADPKKWADLKEHDHRDARIVATHETPTWQILKRTNRQSQNLFADSLCKRLGRAWNVKHGNDDPGSWKAGGEAIHDFLRRSAIDDSHYVCVDGSGLSSNDRVTVRLISDLLLKMRKHRYADAFRESLSICGKDGTLDDRMMEIAGRVLGKSGSIDGVRALSGYASTRSGKTLVFSMIFNAIPSDAEHKCPKLLDDACRAIAAWGE